MAQDIVSRFDVESRQFKVLFYAIRFKRDHLVIPLDFDPTCMLAYKER